MFGEYVFDDSLMQKRLPKETYNALKRTIEQGRSLDPAVAGVVANAMKDWALEKGATHYTHWFQPMTGVTAEKHDAFISPKKDGKVLLEFSGKELVRGEPDASSFPSGGLRATFEARGYTAWDPTSYAFIKDGTLCIPTAFCSYGGQALDKKTPLLRSMQALNKQALRILRLFGNSDAVRVFPTVGPEQEYFLVDKEVYRKRPDLMVTGRTLFGAKPPKGQELEDHYFGVIKPRVQAFMKELNVELWKLGVLAKTEHNEVAPAQHEMAPVFSTVNIAADHNQLTMDIMKKVADKHGLVCLLHEKPFGGVNGSGKHNNYALSTDTGVNLLDPGDTPSENAQFLVFLSAVIAAVDDYQDLMRVAVASAGNDHRLGANEAPPAIISIFLGDELNAVIESIVNASKYEAHERDQMKLGVHILPKFPKDSTDRNRTSPFAFTGNKFEFRSLGSAQSISGPNVILNTAIADTLMKMADELEGAQDFTAAVDALIRKTLSAHMRIIFNGNGYDQSWVEEAERRGLLNLRTTVDALPYYLKPKNVELFERQKVFTAQEVESRYEIKLETYVKVIDIEALSMIDIARHMILPAAIAYSKEVAREISLKKAAVPDLAPEAETALLRELNEQTNALYTRTAALEKAVKEMQGLEDMLKRGEYIRDVVIDAMNSLRAAGDALEGLVGKSYWPMPTYQDLLTSV
ncbi:MAG: glutamine synthetase III [Clostridiales bacterium]|nr:glutamine synthetase III [Clostridiales bacterium]MDO4349277.1 glutamine synthetase III [Eubacteriales bacterium]MDY4008658.1 glutamine synthetase III [Candidatus Limiplasma sp.]